MRIFLFGLILFLFGACDEPKQKTSKMDLGAAKVHPAASREAHAFFNWWIKQEKREVHLNDQLRNKLMNKRDAVELRKYLSNKGINAKVFGNIEDSIKLMEYRSFEKGMIDSKVLWVDQNRLRGCRKIGKEAMWDCLKQDYQISDYYYVSPPFFSSDKLWAVASINYMEVSGDKSNGATRLFKRQEGNQWKEVAILTYWGHFEE